MRVSTAASFVMLLAIASVHGRQLKQTLPICGAEPSNIVPPALGQIFVGQSDYVNFVYPAPFASGTASVWDYNLEYKAKMDFIYHLNGNVVNVKGRNQRDRYDGGLYNAAASAAAFASAITTPGQPSWTVQVYDNGLRRDSVAGFKAGQAPMPANSTAKFPKPLPGPYYKCPINTVRNTTITFKCGTPAFDPLAARFLEVVNVAEPSPCRFTADVITPNACTPDTGLCTAAPVSAPTPAVVG